MTRIHHLRVAGTALIMAAAALFGSTASAHATAAPTSARTVTVTRSAPGAPSVVTIGVKGIYNGATVGVGAIRTYPGNDYDAILPKYKWTNKAPLNWSRTAGVYIGTGFCMQQYYSDTGNSNTWTRFYVGGKDPGPGHWYFDSSWNYIKVIAYKHSAAGCY